MLCHTSALQHQVNLFRLKWMFLHAMVNLPFLFACVAYKPKSKFTLILIRFQWNMLEILVYLSWILQ